MMRSFVRRQGQHIVDPYSQPLRLRGVGIGGWLLLEGYMVKSFGEIDRPRRFYQHLTRTIGPELTTLFFEKWHRTFFTIDDIKLIKQEGFNSIRIPLDYQFLFEPSTQVVELQPIKSNFILLDKIIEACREHEVYVILDMHAAPGGQTGTNIDNSEINHPELFKQTIYQDQLCYIWKTIANRYKYERFIAAYDLLNEPLPNWFSEYNPLLIPLYEKIIQAIRLVDHNHMITLEGYHWSTDWTCFTKRIDDNILLQFHKYWSNPDQESIQEYLTTRENLDVPIIMGEGGENNLEWYYAVFKMYDQLQISYNFWTYKKMDNHNSIISFSKPQNWDQFLDSTLTKEQSILVVEELLESISYSNSTVNKACINHILQQDQLTIPAYGYDYFGTGISFYSSSKKEQDTLRKQDNLEFTDQQGNPIIPSFKQYNGEEYTLNNRVYLKLSISEWVKYSFYYHTDKTPTVTVFSSDNSLLDIEVLSITQSLDKTTYIITLKANSTVYIKNIMVY